MCKNYIYAAAFWKGKSHTAAYSSTLFKASLFRVLWRPQALSREPIFLHRPPNLMFSVTLNTISTHGEKMQDDSARVLLQNRVVSLVHDPG